MIVNSQTGAVAQRIDYDAWGNTTHLQNQDEFTDIGFAGGLYDRDTGLVRFGSRNYDPQTGRWTAKDPILFAGGTSNLYEYALNDPVNIVDPDGLQWIKPPIMVNPKIATAFHLDDIIDGVSDIVGGVKDFNRNYRDMKEANTIGADKYFHCKANCQASQRGPLGRSAAATISEGRELFDEYVKGDSPAQCDADRVANKKGRNPNGDPICEKRCQEFRPKALDSKY